MSNLSCKSVLKVTVGVRGGWLRLHHTAAANLADVTPVQPSKLLESCYVNVLLS